MLDLLWLVLADGRETGGAYSVMEQLMPQDSGPPVLHIHSIDEWFYEIEGELALKLSGQTVAGRAGDFLWIPRGTPPIHSDESALPGAQRLYACRIRTGDHWSRHSRGATGTSPADGKAGPGHDRQGVQQLLVRRGKGRLVALSDGNTVGGDLAKAFEKEMGAQDNAKRIWRLAPRKQTLTQRLRP